MGPELKGTLEGQAGEAATTILAFGWLGDRSFMQPSMWEDQAACGRTGSMREDQAASVRETQESDAHLKCPVLRGRQRRILSSRSYIVSSSLAWAKG